ncbi:erythromycin esterase family protein [Rhizobium lentis]|uniref:Erythromycin esterase n=1 Tax=Rhizobium lentis TaxID=1138194 RepID=A0ABS7I8E0_9HYPH|nr:erythromycin esterase family protein [Rhizobium lentis]MBX4958193.1 erythromycin esterase [Rhizobium lentis]MBX4976364.1 erythromycin esterase [Rhizobium lentis]MBX4988198.1 erythromycin esterase [Rhizobium lentis]MBX5006647.1 erythromycin esterase [Rhizobium lentis]MBX5031244.1 erythromycin esterase [Rhizobium lentis]
MVQSHLQFRDRFDAGRQLATKLVALTLEQPVVYALPRGGVPIALEISRALQAPLDLLLVRKIGAPGTPEVALGAVVEGSGAETVINEEVRMATGADDTYLERARQRELVELERRRALYLGSRARLKPAGRTAIVVDDGLATGATAKAALIAIKNQGAAKVVLAVPVAPEATLAEMRPYADIIVCLHPVRAFPGVGAFYSDFHQLTDEETIGLLRQGWVRGGTTGSAHSRRSILVPPLGLVGDLSVPLDPRGIILFAHGSGSSRLSPRNAAVADRLNDKGFATLLLDLLTADEAKDRRNVFDIPLLAERLLEAAIWIQAEPDIADLPLGLFGASTGAGAAMLAAAELQGRVAAVVSRGGRPDLAGPRLAEIEAPTLLIVGGDDREVLTLNQKALHALACEKLLKIVPGATHLFEEPGALEAVTDLASAWFEHYLLKPNQPPTSATPQSISQTSAVAVLRTAAEPLPSLEDANFAAVFDRFAQARVILLGEASHGTSEFYLARAAITRRLIERHGFTIVAVEADWPDAAAIDRYVRQSPHRPMHSTPFARFPTWMWRNKDVDVFISFLRNHNAKKLQGEKVGFYGLDLYNMTASIAAVLAYLDRVDPEAAQIARERYACLSPWSREPAAYGRASLTEGYALCERPVTRILIDLLQKELQYAKNDGAEFFDAMQNARLVADAERYYRAMYYGARESWNHRDQHMFNALQNILAWTGPKAKAVVWAHNSHIGDARFTEMGMERGELNIGQLCRQAYGRDAALIGFGTHSGTVAAASEWDGPMEIKAIRPSRPGSYEDLFHKVGADRFLVDFRAKEHDNLRRVIAAPRLERYIGVIYRPETERWSHYSYASLSDQYDAFVWFDQSCAVIPLPTEVAAGEDETYPFGL